MTNSRITAALAFCFSLATGLGAASQLTFSDSWKDAPSYNSESKTYGVTATGSFSTSISLPLNGVDLSGANENSMVTLSIGMEGEPNQINGAGRGCWIAPSKETGPIVINPAARGWI